MKDLIVEPGPLQAVEVRVGYPVAPIEVHKLYGSIVMPALRVRLDTTRDAWAWVVEAEELVDDGDWIEVARVEAPT